MRYDSRQNSPCYFPPILGNGDISFAVDAEGGVHRCAASWLPMEAFEGVIFRAGRRQAITHDIHPPAKLFSFGKLRFSAGSEPLHFEQELAEEEGMVRSISCYPNGSTIRTEAFIHPDFPLYCVKKTLLDAPEAQTFEWTYQLCGYDAESQKAILSYQSSLQENGGTVSFLMNGQDMLRGQTTLWMDRPISASAEQDSITLSFTLHKGEEISLFLLLTDDLFQEDPAALYAQMEAKGYETLQQENISAWKRFFESGYVRTSDESLNQIYRTALYHLRCYTTRWSIPVGLNNQCWHGKFFAFDEYYCLLGLLGANQLELAKRVPAFRLNVCLKKAISRMTRLTEEQACFPWQTGEYGNETGPFGFWNDHIFHMCVIALGAYEYYEYSMDREFLSQCYRMLRACAKFFTLNYVYESNGKTFIGKCTDLERLGSSVENAFMTTCGVIRTLEVTAAAAKILGLDEDYRAECLSTAQALREGLPVEDGRYVPYPNCPQKSIGVFSGKFPFDVLADDDPCLMNAWEDFLTNGGAFGNMYKMGSQLSPWYAAWEAEGFARAHRGEEAYDCLKKAYDSVGVFGEMFEINEPAKRLRPWFATASGVYLSAVNDMLVESDGETIRLLPACPLKDVAFRLAIKGGAVLEAEVKGGALLHARLISDSGKTMKLVYQDKVMELSAEK